MTRKTDSTALDNAVQLYLAGKPIKEIIAACGVSRVALDRERARRGIPSYKVKRIPLEEAARLYLSGVSATDLSKRYGIARDTIQHRLREAGLEVRDSAAGVRAWIAQETPEERAKRMDLDAMARLRERRAGADPGYSRCSEHERVFGAWLRERGEHPIPQKAICQYNVDLAIHPVAVEIMGGYWHAGKTRHGVRTPAILNAGWHMVSVWNSYDAGRDDWRYMIRDAADYVVAFAQEARRNPSTVGEYRVIDGSGKLLATGRADDDEWAFIPPLRSRLRPRA